MGISVDSAPESMASRPLQYLTIFLTCFVDILGFGIVIPVLPLYAEHFGATAVQIGWLVGIVVAIVLFTLLSSIIPQDTGGSSPVAGVIKIILGALLLFLAIKQWRTRPA